MIGWYVHHQGMGHAHRADSIARALDEPVTVLSSRARPTGHAAAVWVTLPMDTGPDAADPTAGGVVHWAPLRTPGMTARMAAIADWIDRTQPSLVVVDVSVEVAAFVRLMGVPVVVMAMPGDRDDTAHALAYDMATAIVAPWSRDVYDPQWLAARADKTTWVGSISRFDGRAPSARPLSTTPTVAVLGGAGGGAMTLQAVEQWARADSRFAFRAVGATGAPWTDDVWPVLTEAAVVVTHAGQNAVADVAASGRPAVVVPRERPFAEQSRTATALAEHRVAAVRDDWPAPSAISDALDDALAIGASRWSDLRTSGAATRAAAAIAGVAG
ncbi:glycosyltransferase [Williamsia deligens]|uniref:Glycosyltransferase n=1 Tax=Williamsia deligens TaxID=321325 RepID=A0ABW3G7C6_9NOCA|nr:glycosyltransferase [Williamsia deligens]MCP2192865.1 Glycosyltransferase family 28 C-terminal domain-containing protein [Williamsia deligens]